MPLLYANKQKLKANLYLSTRKLYIDWITRNDIRFLSAQKGINKLILRNLKITFVQQFNYSYEPTMASILLGILRKRKRVIKRGKAELTDVNAFKIGANNE